MSIFIHTEDEKRLKRELSCKQVVNKRVVKTVTPLIYCEGKAVLPMAYGRENGHEIPARSSFPTINRRFTGKLREEQTKVDDEAVALLLKHHTCTLSLPTGFGKTITSIHIAIRTKFKTLVLVNRVVLVDQWLEAIRQNTDASCSGVVPLKEKECSADFVVTNIVNLDKYDIDFMKQFGLVIADEVHLLTSPSFCMRFLMVQPRYLLGLSATPYRLDNLTRVITLFFGEHKVVRNLHRRHLVRKIDSPFTPVVRYNAKNQVDWTDLITQQCTNQRRNDFIAELILSIREGEGILVLCKRRDQVTYLQSKVPGSTILLGGDTTYDPNARVIFATISKGGVGFDNVNIDTLVLATDARDYYLQILGRCFRRPEVVPVVYDIVDRNPMLEAHWRERQKVYSSVGGVFE